MLAMINTHLSWKFLPIQNFAISDLADPLLFEQDKLSQNPFVLGRFINKSVKVTQVKRLYPNLWQIWQLEVRVSQY